MLDLKRYALEVDCDRDGHYREIDAEYAASRRAAVETFKSTIEMAQRNSRVRHAPRKAI